MNRNFCLDVLGLPYGATLEDIKKRFRELALQYHPDVNADPGAKTQFINYLKAYQYLLNEGDQLSDMYSEYKSQGSSAKQPQNATDEFEARQKVKEQMRQRAREYAAAHKKEAEEIEKRVLVTLTTGWPWKAVRVAAAFSCLFALALLFDYWLPFKQIGNKVEAKVYYEYFNRNTIIYVDGASVDVPEKVHLKVSRGDTFLVNFTGMLQEFTGYSIRKADGKIFRFYTEFNLFTFYPIIPFFFLIPGFLFYYKSNSVGFYILYFATCTAYPGLLLHQALREEKLFHLVTWFLE